MTKPAYWDEATQALAQRDPVLRSLIAASPGLHLTRRGDPFTTLARAIVGQQISVKAAQSIW
ncbi:MAG TPA: DNA-3-methyladenine glycosylase 2 family protein, partial [Casimicrobiaceae bacterium]|nr:DNA-3-methyladenine glycosylase 2 family protein [Casimicrobiaceae bacterium]